MRIVFIGAGNLATRLAIGLYEKGFSIVQVYSRTIESASALAEHTASKPTNDLDEIVTDADLYIFSVKDDALAGVLKQIPPNNGIWVHTAGSLPMDVFKGHNRQYGVVYPFQTFSKSRQVGFSNIPFFLEADSPATMEKLEAIFSVLSERQIELSSEKRKYIHLTGVLACNFVNHLYAISQEILEKENIPFDYLLPLIDETAAKVHELKPTEAQTGPAVRYDTAIIEKHLSLLDDERLKAIYKMMSNSIYQTTKKEKT